MITAIGAIAHLRMRNLIKVADIAGALSIEGDLASLRPFDERIQKLRPHPGQDKLRGTSARFSTEAEL